MADHIHLPPWHLLGYNGTSNLKKKKIQNGILDFLLKFNLSIFLNYSFHPARVLESSCYSSFCYTYIESMINYYHFISKTDLELISSQSPLLPPWCRPASGLLLLAPKLLSSFLFPSPRLLSTGQPTWQWNRHQTMALPHILKPFLSFPLQVK